jgi:long-subunit fatty acid transport protein
MSQAQWYVGGELGFNTMGGKNKPKTGSDSKLDRTTAFTIAPMAAYQLTDKFAVGARIGFGFESTTQFNYSGNDDRKVNTTEFGIGVFANYICMQFGKFLVLTEGGIDFNHAGEKSKLGSTSEDGNKYNIFNIGIKPVLAYDMNSKIRLTCALNFMALRFSSESTKYPDDNKETENFFGFGVNTDNVARIGAITVGFLYKF